MVKILKISGGEIANYEDAHNKYLQITTTNEAIVLALKLGKTIDELMPYAIDVLWNEIALGRFLRDMVKNKGGGANQYGNFGAVVSDDRTKPTVQEIVGSKDKSSLLQKVAKFSDKIIEDYIQLCIENKFLPKSGDLKNKNTTISKMTGDNEGYTPIEYIEKVRNVLGEIDLDPASNAFAQKVIKAKKYYSKEDDGLKQKWFGNIFLNPPYSQPDIDLFIQKLIHEIGILNVKSAILLTNNNTDTNWFYNAAKISEGICFTRGRIKFYKKDGSISAPTNGQCFFYFGDNIKKFYNEFSSIGLIMVLYNV